MTANKQKVEFWRVRINCEGRDRNRRPHYSDLSFDLPFAVWRRSRLRARTIAGHVLRNIAMKQRCICMETSARAAMKGQPGLLADLQETRATKEVLIRRKSNHDL
jgi:hypothetical protein